MANPVPTREMIDFFRERVVENFLRYVRIHTTSDAASKSVPSTACQWDLLRLLEGELRELGLDDVVLTEQACVYGTLPGNTSGVTPFTVLAHVDTSQEVSGKDVRPILHANYDGGEIRFPDDPSLVLSPEVSPPLRDRIGDTIITASGRTLLGGDDKAGIAVITALMATLQKFPEWPRGEIRVCFSSDEETGASASRIESSRITPYCYTLDGGELGELEAESFDAHKATITFLGRVTHPGAAYGKMVSAVDAAADFVSRLPRAERPERTRDREGFFYISESRGSCAEAVVSLLIRDFKREENERRIRELHRLGDEIRAERPGLEITIDVKFQYPNMAEFIERDPKVLALARTAIVEAGIKPLERSIRGGTDGSVLSQRGHPCPNIFTGQQMIHSVLEWNSVGGLTRSGEVLMRLAELYVRDAGA